MVAADDAQFGTPEIDVGLWPYMITVPLLRSMPPKKVLELMMTGRRVEAEEAERIGFVNRVVPVAELDEAVDELAATLASKSPLIMRSGRDSFYRVIDLEPDVALASSTRCSRSPAPRRTRPKASPPSPRSASRSGRAAVTA